MPDHQTIAALAAAAALAGGALQPLALPVDQETSIGGVPVACTGLGQTKLDPRWARYPVRVEFSDAHDNIWPTPVSGSGTARDTNWSARAAQVLGFCCGRRLADIASRAALPTSALRREPRRSDYQRRGRCVWC